MTRKKQSFGLDVVIDGLLSSARELSKDRNAQVHPGAYRGILLTEMELKWASTITQGLMLPEGFHNVPEYCEYVSQRHPDRIKIFEQGGEKYYFLAAKR
jgi:hypothetical protein